MNIRETNLEGGGAAGEALLEEEEKVRPYNAEGVGNA
jgi:hypothetical protein